MHPTKEHTRPAFGGLERLLLVGVLALVGCEDPAESVPSAQPAPASDEAAPPADPTATESLAIDLERSTFAFTGSTPATSQTGHFDDWTGTVELAEPVDQTRVSITFQMASLETDDERLTQHLSSADFFDVENHGTATFESTSLRAHAADDSEDTHVVTGNLTLLGHSEPITFPIRLDVGDDEVRAQAAFSIDRTRWGISYPGMQDNLIRDEVVVCFDVRAPRETG